ncbi:DUF4349 domain-containing protein [Microbacterium sp.]|uniref:DUF4349 domain-containing protein n=1 Tax=Microbacterium sp. TaxID=51671 RepID=UPI0028ADFC18|nr:DUF4349 domain-containing protein [Microbacterium sp.]
MSEKSGLPPLSDERIAEMERTIVDRIAHEPRASAIPAADGHRRRRRWVTGLGVAAAFATGALIAPPLLNGLGSAMPSGAGDSAAVSPARDAGGAHQDAEADSADGTVDGWASSGGAVAPRDDDGSKGADTPFATLDDTREIVVTAEMTLRVRDAEKAADDITALAAEHGGFVESASLGLDPSAGDIVPEEPREPGSGWISIRVPAADLNAVMAAAGDDADVVSSSISRDDVTSTAVDLRARIASARTSVERLTDLMSKSGSVADLIAAESALSERQAQLESYEQQLKTLDEQVTLSTLSIQLTEKTTATEADPAGFGDGLLAGWNGLIASMNGLVVVIGFLLPWLGIAAIVLLVVWLIRRRRRPQATD